MLLTTAWPRSSFYCWCCIGGLGGDLTAVTTPETSHLSPPSTVAREREPSASPSALAARSRTAPVSIIVGYGAGKKSRLNL